MRPFYLRLACVLIASAAFSTTLNADDEACAGCTDPPLYISNLTDEPAMIVWQTVLPGQALSPQRGTDAAAQTHDQEADQGFLLFTDPSGSETLTNVVFASIMGSDNSIVAQARFEIDPGVDIEKLHERGLAIILQQDGTLSIAHRN